MIYVQFFTFFFEIKQKHHSIDFAFNTQFFSSIYFAFKFKFAKQVFCKVFAYANKLVLVNHLYPHIPTIWLF